MTTALAPVIPITAAPSRRSSDAEHRFGALVRERADLVDAQDRLSLAQRRVSDRIARIDVTMADLAPVERQRPSCG